MLGNWRTFLSAFVLLFLGSLASGQLLVGYDESAASGAAQAWDVNPNDASSTVLWGGGVDVWGMAYDADTKTVYVNSGTTLYGGELGLGSPPLLGTVTDVAGANISLVGLTWANGGLYGTRNVGDEALYAIDLNTFVATVFLDYAEADYDFGGLAYNPDDGLFYGTNDDATPNGSGLYSIDAFGGGAISLVTPYPAGRTDIDGLAVGNGVAYLVEDEAGNTIHPYDLNAGAYLPSLLSPMQTSEIFSGAAYVIPEPSALALAGLAFLSLVGIRRQS